MSLTLVIGAGRSGVSACKFLLSLGRELILFDDQKPAQLSYFLKSGLGASANLTLALGEPDFKLSKPVSLIVLSPGVAKNHGLLASPFCKNTPIVNEIDLALSFMPDTCVIGITGSNGKSTACVMLESILQSAGLNVFAGGNLGTPLCELLNQNQHADYLVLELSSFQLESLHTKKLEIAIILNITPDHLDRYDSFEDYAGAKFNIINLLTPTGCLITNKNIANLVIASPCNGRGNPESLAKTKVEFSLADYHTPAWEFLNSVSLAGEHNQENALAVSIAAHKLNINNKFIIDGLNKFENLPHRCQFVATKKNINFINDSKGTTVEATKKALSGISHPVHLLLGGISKGQNFASLKNYPHIRDFYIFGQAKNQIYQDLSVINTHLCQDLSEAFYLALERAQIGDTILLSPACSSLDQFVDCTERGNLFINLVNSLS